MMDTLQWNCLLSKKCRSLKITSKEIINAEKMLVHVQHWEYQLHLHYQEDFVCQDSVTHMEAPHYL